MFKNGHGIRQFGSLNNLSQTLNSVLEFVNWEGSSTITFNVTPPTGGEVTFEASFDGINWEAVSLRSITGDVILNMFDAQQNVIGSIAGVKKLRFKTTSAGSADGTVMGNLCECVSIIEQIEFGNPPHKFGYHPIHRDGSYNTAQTNTNLWTPTTGKKFVVTDLSIVVGGSTDGVLSIFDETASAGRYIFKGEIEVATNRQFVFQKSLVTPFVSEAIDNSVKVTTSTAMTVDINLDGYEI